MFAAVLSVCGGGRPPRTYRSAPGIAHHLGIEADSRGQGQAIPMPPIDILSNRVQMVMACSYHLWCERGLDSVPPALGVEATFLSWPVSPGRPFFPVIQAPGRKVTSIKISL